MVSVKVVSESSGNLVKGSRVVVWCGGSTERYTDEKGMAHFENISPGSHSVYVDGVDKGVFALSGVTVVYI